MRRWKRAGTLALLLLLLALAVGADLFRMGVLRLNTPSREAYPVRGVDVSHYQGVVDWEILASEDVQFAFLKATEGSGFVDERFQHNLADAREAGLRVGAYHFFSFDSSGMAQAEHFIRTVPKFSGMLPPVVDLEFYGDKARNPPSREEVAENLTAFLTRVRAHYGQRPILYVNSALYRRYLSEDFQDCDIWIRDTLFFPNLPDGRAWTFWQYSDRERLSGYLGEEPCIDRNVFYGTAEEFRLYGAPKA